MLSLEGHVRADGFWLYKPTGRSGVEGRVEVFGHRAVLTCMQRYAHGLPIRFNGADWAIEGIETKDTDTAIVDLYRE